MGVILSKPFDFVKGKAIEAKDAAIAKVTGYVSDKTDAVKQRVVTKKNKAVQNVVQKKDAVVTKVNTVYTAITSTVNNIKDGITTRYNHIKTAVCSAIDSVKTKYSNTKTAITTKFTNTKNRVSATYHKARETKLTKKEKIKYGLLALFFLFLFCFVSLSAWDIYRGRYERVQDRVDYIYYRMCYSIGLLYILSSHCIYYGKILAEYAWEYISLFSEYMLVVMQIAGLHLLHAAEVAGKHAFEAATTATEYIVEGAQVAGTHMYHGSVVAGNCLMEGSKVAAEYTVYGVQEGSVQLYHGTKYGLTQLAQGSYHGSIYLAHTAKECAIGLANGSYGVGEMLMDFSRTMVEWSYHITVNTSAFLHSASVFIVTWTQTIGINVVSGTVTVSTATWEFLCSTAAFLGNASMVTGTTIYTASNATVTFLVKWTCITATFLYGWGSTTLEFLVFAAITTFMFIYDWSYYLVVGGGKALYVGLNKYGLRWMYSAGAQSGTWLYVVGNILWKFFHDLAVVVGNFLVISSTHIYNLLYIVLAFILQIFGAIMSIIKMFVGGIVYCITFVFGSIIWALEETVFAYMFVLHKYNMYRELLFVAFVLLISVYCTGLLRARSTEDFEDEVDAPHSHRSLKKLSSKKKKKKSADLNTAPLTPIDEERKRLPSGSSDTFGLEGSEMPDASESTEESDIEEEETPESEEVTPESEEVTPESEEVPSVSTSDRTPSDKGPSDSEQEYLSESDKGSLSPGSDLENDSLARRVEDIKTKKNLKEALSSSAESPATESPETESPVSDSEKKEPSDRQHPFAGLKLRKVAKWEGESPSPGTSPEQKAGMVPVSPSKVVPEKIKPAAQAPPQEVTKVKSTGKFAGGPGSKFDVKPDDKSKHPENIGIASKFGPQVGQKSTPPTSPEDTKKLDTAGIPSKFGPRVGQNIQSPSDMKKTEPAQIVKRPENIGIASKFGPQVGQKSTPPTSPDDTKKLGTAGIPAKFGPRIGQNIPSPSEEKKTETAQVAKRPENINIASKFGPTVGQKTDPKQHMGVTSPDIKKQEAAEKLGPSVFVEASQKQRLGTPEDKVLPVDKKPDSPAKISGTLTIFEAKTKSQTEPVAVASQTAQVSEAAKIKTDPKVESPTGKIGLTKFGASKFGPTIQSQKSDLEKRVTKADQKPQPASTVQSDKKADAADSSTKKTTEPISPSKKPQETTGSPSKLGSQGEKVSPTETLAKRSGASKFFAQSDVKPLTLALGGASPPEKKTHPKSPESPGHKFGQSKPGTQSPVGSPPKGAAGGSPVKIPGKFGTKSPASSPEVAASPPKFGQGMLRRISPGSPKPWEAEEDSGSASDGQQKVGGQTSESDQGSWSETEVIEVGPGGKILSVTKERHWHKQDKT